MITLLPDDPGTPSYIFQVILFADLPSVEVMVGMVTYAMALLNYPQKHSWMSVNILTDTEKSRPYAMRSKYVQDIIRDFRHRTIVECEVDLLSASIAMPYGTWIKVLQQSGCLEEIHLNLIYST